MEWTLFCRVIDNLGDVGVCWRLAADLAARGEQVHLWVDEPAALGWMAPDGAPGVEVHRWAELLTPERTGDVVIEAFGCDPPAAFVRRMSALPHPPVWINLEYLSAESYVERSHGLPSPQRDGLTKWFFYPGFTTATGGLIRERDLPARRTAFDARAWLAGHAAPQHPAERVVSLFCYDNPAMPSLIARLSAEPTLLLVTPGPAARAITQVLGETLACGALRAVLLPWLSQTDFDHLLWASDLNLVRGEDSFVRAQWAGRPFVWQAYPQADGAQAMKLDAFLQRHLHAASPALASALRAWWSAWNNGRDLPDLPPLRPWQSHAQAWCDGLLAQRDLAARLLAFVDTRRRGESG